MIIDSHIHIFPFLGRAPGFEDQEDHSICLQREMAIHRQSVRRPRDGAVKPGHTIWAPDDPSLTGREAVDFRSGRFDRIEWTRKGVEVHRAAELGHRGLFVSSWLLA